MERSLRIERAARVRAEQAARHAKAAIGTAETLRAATVKAAAAHLEAGMAQQERLLKKQAELTRELQVVSEVCKESEALTGESSYARQIGRLKAQLHVTTRPLGSATAHYHPGLPGLTLRAWLQYALGSHRRAAQGPMGGCGAAMGAGRFRGVPHRRSCVARPRPRRRWSRRLGPLRSRCGALHLHCPPLHLRANRQCTWSTVPARVRVVFE